MFCLRLREAATLLCLGGWFHNRVNALNNGVSTLPPMGWSTWNAYGPAITEQVIKDTADAMVSSGMKEAGYQYINIDDMWAEMERNENGTLVANKQKFPSGMKALGDYIHSKGLKVGWRTINVFLIQITAGGDHFNGRLLAIRGRILQSAQQIAVNCYHLQQHK